MTSKKEAARVLGEAGGRKGGPARAKELSSQRRSEIASEGGKARQRGTAKSPKSGSSTAKK